jgi:hypothetical protein
VIDNATPTADMSLPQGSVELLRTEPAKRLLSSTIPVRLAFTALDGSPRVVPTWFHWTGVEIVMGTFVASPTARQPASRIRALRARPQVALTIDTDDAVPLALSIRGTAVVTEHAGVVPEYALSARRYLGDEAAGALLTSLDDPVTVMSRIAVVPAWVGLIDFDTRLPAALGGVSG